MPLLSSVTMPLSGAAHANPAGQVVSREDRERASTTIGGSSQLQFYRAGQVETVLCGLWAAPARRSAGCRVSPTRVSCRAGPVGEEARPAQERSHARDNAGGTREMGFWRLVFRDGPAGSARALVEVQAEALLPAELAVRVSRAAAVARGERAFCPAPSARAMDEDLGHRAVADFLVKTPHQRAGK